jgi:hypothetical protein
MKLMKSIDNLFSIHGSTNSNSTLNRLLFIVINVAFFKQVVRQFRHYRVRSALLALGHHALANNEIGEKTWKLSGDHDTP